MRFRRALGEREKKNPVRPPLFVLFQYSYMNAAIWYLTQQHSGINKTDATPELITPDSYNSWSVTAGKQRVSVPKLQPGLTWQTSHFRSCHFREEVKIFLTFFSLWNRRNFFCVFFFRATGATRTEVTPVRTPLFVSLPLFQSIYS